MESPPPMPSPTTPSSDHRTTADSASESDSDSERQQAPDGPQDAEHTFDAIIIGAGSAGLAALRAVRKHSDNFLIVNAGHYGTTCARVGCMPSKLLIEAANAYHRRHTFETFGITGSQALAVDLPAVLRRLRRLRDEFVAGTVHITNELGGKSVAGQARLLGPGRVQVSAENGSGDQVFHTRSLILAPGSHPVLPRPWQELREQLGEDRILTTDTLFEQTTLGPRMAVLGMGPIGIEMAQALARLGVEVHGYATKELLGGLSDPTVNAELREALEAELTLHVGDKATLHATEGGGIEVRSGAHRVVVDQVLVAIGRRPNLDGLGLDTLGVALNEHGMPEALNPNSMQVGDLPVYMAGDATSLDPLLHVAVDEGHMAGINAMADEPRRFQRRTPLAIVFSEPNAAVVGKGFAALQKKAQAAQDKPKPKKTDRHEGKDGNDSKDGKDAVDAMDARGIQPYITGAVNFARQGRARAGQRNDGRLCVYADQTTGRILGAELCAPAGEHLAHLLALAIAQKMTVAGLLGMAFYHPVLEEGLRTALRDAARQLDLKVNSDLATCEAIGATALE